MCGRFASGRDPADLASLFDAALKGEAPAPSWNVAPTDAVHVVLERGGGGEPGRVAPRELRPARWGLVPSWSADSRDAARRINARLETAAEKPSYRGAFSSRRCLLPADGYYEWQRGADGRKTPYFLGPRDRGVLAFAGLYEWWRDPAQPRGDPRAWLLSTTILTTAAIPALAHLHDRMPVIVDPDLYHAWLDPALRDSVAARDFLDPAAAQPLDAYPVDPAVGNVANNGPHLNRPRAGKGREEANAGQGTRRAARPVREWA